MTTPSENEFEKQLKAMQPVSPEVSMGQMMFAAGQKEGQRCANKSFGFRNRVWQVTTLVFAMVAAWAWVPAIDNDGSSQIAADNDISNQTGDVDPEEDGRPTIVDNERATTNGLVTWLSGLFNQDDFGASYRERNAMIANDIDGLPKLETAGFFSSEPSLTIRGSRSSNFNDSF